MSLDSRKVRSVYDAIDTGAYKLAIQTCNKLLKKSPKSDIVKTLKSLALLRSSKLDEAIQLCDEVLAARPTDEDVLSALTHVLRHLERHEDIITLYEDAFKKHPQNEELGTQAFMAMVRIGNWKTAQQISLKMSKTFASDPRLLSWSAMTAVLQASDPTTAPSMKPVLLSLALRLFQQLPQQHSSFSSADKLHLHLEILLAFDEPKLQEAYDLLASDQGRALIESSLSIDEQRRTIWAHLHKHAEERELCKRRLDSGDRNWVTFIAYLDSSFALFSSPSADDLTGDVLPDPTYSYLRSLAISDGRKERGSHLARLEFEKRARSLSENITVSSERATLLVLMKGYFADFGDKACCFEDLRPYADILDLEANSDEKSTWLQFLKQQDPDVTNQKALLRTLSAFKLLRYTATSCELAKSPEDASLSELSRGVKYFRTYLEAIRFVGRDLESTELQPADDLALLSASSFIQAWIDGGRLSFDPLHQAIVVLEYGSSRSVNNYQFRLLLIRIYLLLGAHSLALQHYKRLGVKSVQHETLSHFIMNRGSMFSLANNGDLGMIQEALDASQIYQDNSLETPDMLTKALQYEKYSQIPIFIEFEDRLDRSLERDLIKIEHIRMRFAVEPPTYETLPLEIGELDFMLFSGKVHHDNRDFSVLPNYQRKGQSIEEQTAIGPRPGVNWYNIFVRIYIRALNKAIEPDFHSSNLSHITEEEMNELTDAERLFVRYTHILAHWLWPSDKPFPKPGDTPYPKYNPEEYDKESGTVRNVVDHKNETNGHSSVPEALQMEGTSEAAVSSAEAFAERLKTAARGGALPWEILHLANIMQEAFVLLNIQSSPFGPNVNGKQKKADPIWSTIKSTKAKIATILHDVSAELGTYADRFASPDATEMFRVSCKPLAEGEDVEQIARVVSDAAKNLRDSQKAIFSSLGQGITKIADGKRPVLPAL